MTAIHDAATLRHLFDAIDAKDTARFLSFLSDNATFAFGNLAPNHGTQDVGAAVDAFFASIQKCRHAITEAWLLPDRAICHGTVSYLRKDGKEVTVPFANIMALNADGHINDYRIFADITPLFV